MSEIGEIKIFAFSASHLFPERWLPCEGALVSIKVLPKLFSIIGYRFGGGGNLFQLPDFRDRIPIVFGDDSPPIGRHGGANQQSLTVAQMPKHDHHVNVHATAPNSSVATDAFMAGSPSPVFATSPPDGADDLNMGEFHISETGNNLGHDNIAPSLTFAFAIFAGVVEEDAESEN